MKPPQEVMDKAYDMVVGDVVAGWECVALHMEEFPCGVDCCGYAEIVLTLRSPSGEEVEVEI